MGDTLPPERVALLIKHDAVEQLRHALRGGQHRVPGIQPGQRPRQGHEKAEARRRQPSIAIRSPEQLFGRRLGTLLNYVYPELEPYFADRRIQRDDSPTLAASLLKLEHGRIDALIDTDLSVFYLTEHMKPATPLRIDPLWAPPSPVHCAFNAEFAKAYPQALARLDLMVKDGQVQRWVEAYTGGRRLEIAVSEP